ncbi:MAG TPA: hypothetical protein VHE80_03990, partial [Acidimicrobiales bacterium]|nr:hypothetical protein [Acidimicrobiales bacterium]
LEQRDVVLEGIEAKLARKLKRALQDEQNEILDRLRSTKGRLVTTELLPSTRQQARHYRAAAEESLAEAAAAGVAFVSGQGPGPNVSDVAAELAEELVRPLSRRLIGAMDGAGDDDRSALTERIGAAYREVKTHRSERLAGDCVIAAFSRGTLSAVPGRPLRWVVDDQGGPCADCDDNALAGPTPAREAFPTGQAHPPAHAGCRCLLVPTTT